MSDATCRFEIELGFEGGSAADPDATLGVRPTILALLHEHGLGPATYASPENELDEARWPGGPHMHTATWWGHPAEVYISGTPRSFGVRLRWTVPLPAPALCEPIVRFVRAVVGALPPGGRFGWRSHLVARDVLHRSPPLDYRTPWDSGSILDLIADDAAAVSPTAERQVPPPASREVRNGMHVIRWAREPLTLEELQRATFAQEDWLRASPEARPVSPDEWNALGDRRVDLAEDGNVESLDVRWEGTPRDAARLAELAARTPPPTIVCPSRRAAIALSRQAAAGLVIVYLRAGSLWEPSPPGYVHDTPLVEPHLALDFDLSIPDPGPDDGAALLRRFVALAIEHGIAARASYLESDERPGDRLAIETLTWPQRMIYVRGPDVHDATIELSGRGTELAARVRWPWVEGMRLIGGLSAFIAAVRAILPAGSTIVDNSLVPVGFELVSLPPLREFGRWPYGAVLDLVGNQVQAWARDPLTRDELQRAWLEQQRWVATGDRSLVHEGWNEAGEKRIVTSELVVLPPRTLYDHETGEGYKALAVDDDGSTSERALAELVALRTAARLPDERPLTSIVVMTTSRAGALALAPRAHALGLRVAYLDDDRWLWEVA